MATTRTLGTSPELTPSEADRAQMRPVRLRDTSAARLICSLPCSDRSAERYSPRRSTRRHRRYGQSKSAGPVKGRRKLKVTSFVRVSAIRS